MQSHETVHHNGVRETLTEIRAQFWIIKGRQAFEIRAQFWIIKGRQAVKNVLSKCVTCKKMLESL